jgi:hypothetical protein
VSPLRRHTRIAAAAVGVAAVFISAVGTAGAQPLALNQPERPVPAPLSGLHVPSPFHITRIIASDRVDFDIVALPGKTAEVTGGTSPSFTFNVPGSTGSPGTGWTEVTHVATGHYCLNGAGFNYPAVVSVADRNGTAPSGGLVQYDSFGRGCPGVGVFTYQITT